MNRNRDFNYLTIDTFVVWRARRKYMLLLRRVTDVRSLQLQLLSLSHLPPHEIYLRLQQLVLPPALPGVTYHFGIKRNMSRVSLIALIFFHLYCFCSVHKAWTFLLSHSVFARSILDELGYEHDSAVDLQNYLDKSR